MSFKAGERVVVCMGETGLIPEGNPAWAAQVSAGLQEEEVVGSTEFQLSALPHPHPQPGHWSQMLLTLVPALLLRSG